MTNLELFPMQALASIMTEMGFEYPNARKIIASELSTRLGQEIKITPKFHECFNFVVDVLKGRVRRPPVSVPSLTFQQRHPYMFEKMAFSMEPCQVATFHQFFKSPSVLGDVLAQHLHQSYPQDLMPSEDVNERYKAYLLELFEAISKAWSVR